MRSYRDGKQVVVPAWGDRNRDVEHFRGFKTQIDSLFEDWFGRCIGGVLSPRVDVAEDEKTVTLSTELPGVLLRTFVGAGGGLVRC